MGAWARGVKCGRAAPTLMAEVAATVATMMAEVVTALAAAVCGGAGTRPLRA